MSRHICHGVDQASRPVLVTMGWDRPLQGFFMMVEREDLERDDENRYLFNNLDCAESHPPTMTDGYRRYLQFSAV